MAQETNIGSDWAPYSKDADKAQKELNVEPYCKIIITRQLKTGDREVLYVYDIPRWMVWEYDWVIRWREARFINMYPRDHVQKSYAFYDRNTGLELGFDSLRSRQIAAKALITKYTRAKGQYIESMKTTLFFDETNDDIVKKLNCKIASAESRLAEITKEINNLIQKQDERQGNTHPGTQNP